MLPQALHFCAPMNGKLLSYTGLHVLYVFMQELLDHAFLRPTEGPGGPAPGQVGLTRDQLKKLLTQVACPYPCSSSFVACIMHVASCVGPRPCKQCCGKYHAACSPAHFVCAGGS